MNLRAFFVSKIYTNTVILFLLLPGLQSQTLVIINGVSGSGKTTVCNRTLDLLNKPIYNEPEKLPWVYVALDDEDLDLDDKENMDVAECNLQLHKACLNKVIDKLEHGNNVLCDTVIDDGNAYNLYAQVLKKLHDKKGIKLLTSFMYSPLEDLVKHLHERNKKSNSKDRFLGDVLVSFQKMFITAQQNYGFGYIKKGEVSEVINTEKCMKKIDKQMLKKSMSCDGLFALAVPITGDPVIPAQKTFILPRHSYNLILDAQKPAENIAYALYEFIAGYAKTGTYNSNDLKKMNGFSWLKISKK